MVSPTRDWFDSVELHREGLVVYEKMELYVESQEEKEGQSRTHNPRLKWRFARDKLDGGRQLF